MVFKVCNAEQDPLSQGFTEGSYDVIIAYMVIHATAKLDETMGNLRRLLKPGGFLLVGEGGSDGPLQAGAGFIFGPLPGWWRGVNEGRNLSPLINVPQWDAILRRTGFSGIDTISPPRLLDTFGIILFVSQAVDERINLLREPLSASANMANKKVVLIGGQSPPVTHLVQGLESIFAQIGSRVFVYKTLEQVDENVLDAGSTVVSLTELDEPVFKDITPERWYRFRQIFETERTVLWLTSGRLEDEPYSNMTVGFGRSAVHEEDELRLQFLDVSSVSQIDTRTIAEALVRLNTEELDDEAILYTIEPEIIIDAQGRHLVPRLSPIPAANDRYNSIQRPIIKRVDVSKTAVELERDGNSCTVRQLSRYETLKKPAGYKTIELHTSHTVLSALKTPLGHKFLALAVDSFDNRFLTLVPSLTSVLKVPQKSAVSCKHIGLSEESILTLVAAHLVSMTIVGSLVAGQKLVIHNASDAIAQAVTAQASAKDIQITFTTDCAYSASIPSSWIRLPSYVGRSDLTEMIPSNIACFVSFSNHNTENELTILSTLSSHCRKETSKSIYSPDAFDIGLSQADMLGDILQSAVGYIQGQDCNSAEAVSLEQLAGEERREDPLTIIDWTSPTSIPFRVSRFDIKPVFKGDKTYWLCGLSGALGISLCDWMIDRGVRYLVLTSRNPKIDPAWIKDHERNGVTVRILLWYVFCIKSLSNHFCTTLLTKSICSDVTDEKALRSVHQAIIESLPPIIGVLNGAMVLRDVSVRNMMFDQVRDVIRPKILGSMHLDRIFHSVDLDFFVLLSSINCVIGNVGQANYAAANMGMCGVAANRRKRGLASSVVNVGAIIGVGYITQSDRQLDVTVAKTAMMHLSEEDFHQIFLEAMEAGYPDSTAGPEISTGLLDISPDSANIPKWYSDPKFSRFIVHKTNGIDDKKEQTNATSIQDHLEACRSEQELRQVIKRECSIPNGLTRSLWLTEKQGLLPCNCAKSCRHPRLTMT